MRISVFLIVLAIIFGGCADKRLARKYIQKQNYEKAYEEYLKFADRGFPDAAEKVARLIYLQRVYKPPYVERKYALIAYNDGYERAALYIADSYFREKKYLEALKWYQKVDFKYYSDSDFKKFLVTLDYLPTVKEKLKYLQKLEEFALKSNNPKLLKALGKYYLQQSPYYNPQKAVKLLKKAYSLGDYQAAVILGVYYIKHGDKKEGYELLKKVLYKDKIAAYYIGEYLYSEMVDKERKLNSQCITANFQYPLGFFKDKLTIYKFNDLFSRKNLKKAYSISYNLGNKRALYKLIRLDLEDNTFELTPKNTYSGFDLNSSVKFLSSQNDVESKLILAKIYEKYLYLDSYKKAKEIYEWYKQINKLQALWRLYQYEKRFENRVNFEYLNYLTSKKFVPAIVEKAYQEILKGINVQKNKKTLEYYARQDNILALNYLGSLYSKEIFTPKTKSFYYYKKACVLEKKPFYIPSEDLKMANYYNDVLKNEEKKMTINYYYHQMKNRQAQLNLASFYKEHCNYDKFKSVLNELVSEADKNGLFLYYQSMLEGYLDGDYKKAIEYLKEQNDTEAYLILGDVYANGLYVDIDPEIAEKYYLKAVENGYDLALLRIGAMLEKLNVDGIYNEKIIKIYKEAIKRGIKTAKINLAKFYYYIGKKKKAIALLKSVKDKSLMPKARYLLYVYTGKDYFIRRLNSNYGYLLLVRAEKAAKYNPRKALYYVFRAMLCNTPRTTKLALELMKAINNARVIENIYQKAKKAPRCYLY